MRGVALLLPLIFACGPGGKGGQNPKNTPLSAKDIVQRSSPAIVRVEAQGPDGEQFGTGFIVDKTGVVATNFHVIKGTSDIKVKLHDGTHYQVMHVLNVDVGRDLVLVKFAPEKPMPTVRLGDSDKVATGEKIVAIGNPLGVFENTVSEGLISSIREICSKEDVEREQHGAAPSKDDKGDRPKCPIELHLLQISAPISQGSSGGPLFNQIGEVVGVTTAIIAQGQLINFAMPANYLKPLLQNQQPITLADFAKATQVDPDEDNQRRLPKKPPEPAFAKDGFPAKVYDNCKPDQIAAVINEIDSAISLGAPLYNDEKFEACFRIYEGAVAKIEKGSVGGGCKGVRGVFGDVLLKIETSDNFAEKAWHIRYTFDGFVKGAAKLRKP